jgi:hypothetical protein
LGFGILSGFGVWNLGFNSWLDLLWILALGAWSFTESGSLYAHSQGMTGSQPHSDPVLTEDLWQILFIQASASPR